MNSEKTKALLPTFSRQHTNYAFLDGDNFLWQGTLQMYERMFSSVIAEMAAAPGDPRFSALGKRIFLDNLHLSDFERYPIIMSALEKEGIAVTASQGDFVRHIKQYFIAHYKKDVRALEGAEGLLRRLSSIRSSGIDLRVFLVSLNMDFALPLIVESLGWKNHFNGTLLGAPFENLQVRKSKAQLMREAMTSSGGVVFVAGDSTGDIKAARALAGEGFSVRSLGITSGLHRAEELLAVGAECVLDSLVNADSYLDSLVSQPISSFT